MNEQYVYDGLTKISNHIQDCLCENNLEKLAELAEAITGVRGTSEFILPIFEELRELSQKTAEFNERATGDNKAKARNIAMLTAAGLAALPVAGWAYSKHKKGKEYEKVMHHILRDDTLRQDPGKSLEYYEKIKHYAPSLATDPHLVTNVLKEWHRVGGKSIQPESIKNLLETESAVHESKPVQTSLGKEVAKGLGTGALLTAIPSLLKSMGGN